MVFILWDYQGFCVCPIKPHIPDSETSNPEFVKPDFANWRNETKQATQQLNLAKLPIKSTKQSSRFLSFVVFNCIAFKAEGGVPAVVFMLLEALL